jgi:Ca-activated chloride channel homolog
MTFIWPLMLISLLLVPLFVVLYVRLQRQRRLAAERYGSLGFVQGSSGRRLGLRRHLPPAIFLGGLAVLLVALARPQTVVSLPRQEGTVILTFDVSGSMAADDMKPTRLDAAKIAAEDFVQRQPTSVQIGVVAYSDNGFTVQTPTDDQAQVLATIARLTPARGTSVGNGILSALHTLDAAASGQTGPFLYSNLTPEPTATPAPVPPGSDKSAAIILLTDGENNENPDPLQAAQAAADRGVRVYTIGIGSAAGTTLHVNGFTVHTQLDEATLQQIAQITGGVYYNAQNETDLRKIYAELSPQFVVKPEKTEVTSIFAGASLLAMLAGGLLSLAWFSRLP